MAGCHPWKKAMKEESEVMRPLDECPLCGGKLLEKEVEKLLRGGVNTAVVKVKADVCLQCGERLYPEATVRRFELIRQKLATEDVAESQLLGQTYQVA
jgi:YgiT-type zinc finger domain-containing protein